MITKSFCLLLWIEISSISDFGKIWLVGVNVQSGVNITPSMTGRRIHFIKYWRWYWWTKIKEVFYNISLFFICIHQIFWLFFDFFCSFTYSSETGCQAVGFCLSWWVKIRYLYCSHYLRITTLFLFYYSIGKVEICDLIEIFGKLSQRPVLYSDQMTISCLVILAPKELTGRKCSKKLGLNH